MKKKCRDCGKVKQLGKFYVNKANKDGYESLCIDCRKLMRIKNEQRLQKERKSSIIPKYKVCRICNKKQVILNFTIAPDRKSGYRNECKSCQKIIHARYVRRIKKENKNLTIPKSKVCHDCNKRKSISMFAKNSHSKDGYGSQCRICRKSYHQTLLDKDPDYDRKRSARRRSRPKVREEQRLQSLQWRKDNPGRGAELTRLWREKEGNKEKVLERQRQWSKTESGKRSIRISHMNRRNHRRLGKITILQIEESNKNMYGVLTCEYCRLPILNTNYHMDHKIPIVRGGENTKENLCISCQTCNLSKRTMTSEEFLKSNRLQRIMCNRRLKVI